MDAAGVVDLLHLDVEAEWAAVERHVADVLVLLGRALREAQRLAPEAGGGGEIVGLAIDDEPAEAAAMHDRPPPSLQRAMNWAGDVAGSTDKMRSNPLTPPRRARMYGLSADLSFQLAGALKMRLKR